MDYCYYLPVPYRPCQSKLFVTIHMFPFSQSIVLRLIRLVHANTRVMIMSLCGCIVISLGQSTSQRVRKTYMAEEITTKV